MDIVQLPTMGPVRLRILLLVGWIGLAQYVFAADASQLPLPDYGPAFKDLTALGVIFFIVRWFMSHIEARDQQISAIIAAKDEAFATLALECRQEGQALNQKLLECLGQVLEEKGQREKTRHP